MSLSIDFNDETTELSDHELSQLEELLNSAAAMEGIEPETEVSVTFVLKERIRELNREYRDKDEPTDVISFAMEETLEEEVVPTGLAMPRVLGDIIISVSIAKEQAEEYNHSFMRELGFLAVHGFLHLLGYDHLTEEEEQIMFSRQKEILDAYGLTR